MKNLKLTMTTSEITVYVNHIIKTNREIQKFGRTPIAVEIIGAPGLGKTQLAKQIAEMNGMKFVKISLAQMSDNGDMLGSPIRTQKMFKEIDGQIEVKWAPIGNIADDFVKNGWCIDTNTPPRTEYCKPSWISDMDTPILLLLDDWTRANPDFLQACMELIESQTFTSWALPPASMVMLTSNPAGGDMQVNEIDQAQRTRFNSVEIKWSKESWAEWAENHNIDGRCINFMLHDADSIFSKTNQEAELVNPRTLVKFFDSISSIKGDYADKSNNVLVSMCGQTSVGQEVTNLFMAFIKGKLDRIPQPKDMYELKEDDVIATLESVCNDQNGYRNDIASMLSQRLVNYSIKRCDDKDWKTKDIDRLINMLINPKIFKEDTAFYIVRALANSKHQKVFQGLFRNAYLNKALIQ